MSLMESIYETFASTKVQNAVFSTISIIGLGFWLRKKNIFTSEFGKILSKVVLSVSLPALAFKSFMLSIDTEKLTQGMGVLVWGFVIYIVLILITPFMYYRYEGDRRTTLQVLTDFGSTTFFGIPIVSAIYGAQGVIYSSIFNIGYRVFLYSYGYVKMSGLKMELNNIKTMFVNPIVLATFGGLFIWIFQESLPQVMVATEKGLQSYGFLRIDMTLPWLYSPILHLANLASPLAWLAIGSTLGEISFQKAASDKTSWYYSFNKVLLVPILNLAILLALISLGWLPLKYEALATIIIMMATPAATVVASYAISFNREALLASNASLISTVVSILFMPIWIVILEVLRQVASGLFT